MKTQNSKEYEAPAQVAPDCDAVVIGAGITGMYQVYLLKKSGLKVRGYEAGPDVGGTWFWNRYPGCRLDTESYAYGYFVLNGIMPDWEWSERFASQPELLRYARTAAERMGIRENYTFNTQVTSAHFEDDANCWRVTLSNGNVVRSRFLVTAVGPLSATRMPDIPGIDGFKGQSFHSSRWPRDDKDGPLINDFTGKRVGLIGTGATGVQIIPVVAETAQSLHVFQRTPNWCTPLGNHELDSALQQELMGDPDEFLDFIKSTPTAFPYARSRKKASEASEEERKELFEGLYNMPGYGIWLAGYRDLLTNKASNKFLADFVANKIRERVHDPLVAEKLVPKDHAFGTRRVPMETNYYEVYNQPNVKLVDIKEAPIECITPDGIQTADGHIDLDVIIYATGFNAVTGALDRIDIRGRQGQALKAVWADGPVTYLGLQISGFPNLFTLVGAHNGAAFCNIGICGGLQVEWVANFISYLEKNKYEFCEPEPVYQEQWTDKVYADYSKTLLAESDAWWVKVTEAPDGTIKKRALIYVGDAPEYRAYCDEIAANDYVGFRKG